MTSLRNQKLFKDYQELFEQKELTRKQGQAYIKDSSPVATIRAHQRSHAHVTLLRFLESLEEDELDYIILQKFRDFSFEDSGKSKKISLLLKVSELR